MAVIRSATFAAAVTAVCEEDIRDSQRITAQQIAVRSRWRRLLDRFAYMLRWWL
jgi:hypothetical protein